MALDEQTARSATRIVDLHAWLRVQDMSHEDRHLPQRMTFASALPLAFCKLAEEVLISTTEQVRLHIVQSQPVAAQNLDECGKRLMIQNALTSSSSVETHHINDSLKAGIFPRY
jgi:hypothetical protein